MLLKSETSPAEHGVHLVGSVPGESTEDALRKYGDHLAKYLRRVPDGETGSRWYFINFQIDVFAQMPHVVVPFEKIKFNAPKADHAVFDEQVAKTLASQPLETTYDTHAIESYAIFSRLRDEEKLFSPATRFQVSLPTPLNFLALFIEPQHQTHIEPYYEQALYNAISNIQSHIPKSSLAIQLDMAVDMAFLEGMVNPHWDETKESVFDGVVARATRMAAKVDSEVELGFHLCYGDIDHQHWKQPVDTGNLTRLAVALMRATPRKIDWIHIPVPIDRTDDAYFAPLVDFEKVKAELEVQTVLYLGLVHANDPVGTKQRISAARKFLKGGFGVATECGLGRTPVKDLDGIFEISREVSIPVS